VDPLVDFDWAAHWRRLVEAREAEVPVRPGQDFWAPIAPRLSYDPAEAENDPLLHVMAPYLGPHKTAIDAGAGAGRHTVPLADRLEWVTAVEPSEAMRARIPHRDNITIVAAGWDDAEVAPADLVVCAHVLYFIADPVPFIRKLQASARERVFAVMRDRQHLAPGEQLYEVLAGRPRGRMPQLSDLWNLLKSMGVDADVQTFTYTVHNVYEDMDEVIAETRHRLGDTWRDDEGRAWLERNLQRQEDGRWVYGGPMVAGVVHWAP
jgi:methyltransferase family protein